MAANSELFGKDILEWLEDSEPDEDEELDSLLIAASDEYESSQSPPPASASAPAQKSSSHTRISSHVIWKSQVSPYGCMCVVALLKSCFLSLFLSIA